MRRFLAVALLAAGLAACGDVHSVINVTVEPDGGDASSSATFDGAVEDSATPQGDAGQETSVTGDASPDVDAAAPSDIFDSLPFVPGNPAMNANNVSAHSSVVPLEGKNCSAAGGCHGETKPLTFAGTVYSTVTGGTTVAGALVRAVDGSGNVIGDAYSDDQGNFWFAGSALPAGARVGVRTAGSKRIMVATVNGAAGSTCQSTACHGSTTERIHVP